MQALTILLSEFDASTDHLVVCIWCKRWPSCLNLMQALTIMFTSRSVYFDRCWTRRMSNGTAHMNGPSSGKYIDTIGKWKLAQLSAATFDLPIHHHWFPDGDKECHGVPNLLSKHAWAVLRLLYRQNSFLSVEYWKKKGAIFTQNTVVLKVSLWKDKEAVSKFSLNISLYNWIHYGSSHLKNYILV